MIIKNRNILWSPQHRGSWNRYICSARREGGPLQRLSLSLLCLWTHPLRNKATVISPGSFHPSVTFPFSQDEVARAGGAERAVGDWRSLCSVLAPFGNPMPSFLLLPAIQLPHWGNPPSLACWASQITLCAQIKADWTRRSLVSNQVPWYLTSYVSYSFVIYIALNFAPVISMEK